MKKEFQVIINVRKTISTTFYRALMFPYFLLVYSARGRVTTFDATNPIVGELGKNITMQWSINLTGASSIRRINAYFEDESIKKTQIVYWANGGPHIFINGGKYYKDRLHTQFANYKFRLSLTNLDYKDKANFTVYVHLKPHEVEYSTVTVNVHGMFFS